MEPICSNNSRSCGVLSYRREEASEAAEYYHIGEKKLRSIVDEHPKADFIIMNGNRVLLKKKQFEKFLDDASYV